MLKVSGIKESKAPRRFTPPWCMSHQIPFEYRRIGTTGCEILDQDGNVFAWTVDEAWATAIVKILNEHRHDNVA